MSTTQKIVVALAAALGLAAAAAGIAVAAKNVFGTKHTTTTRVAADVRRVVVDASSGDVRVTAERRGDVAIRRTTSWLFSKPTVRQYVREGVLHLESRCSHSLLCESDYTVRIPTGVAVSVTEDAADVRVHGSPGAVTVRTDAGDVDVDVSRAPRLIDARVDAGDVHVTVPRGTYAVYTHTDAGDETVRNVVRHDLAKRVVRASADAGDVTVEGR